MTSQAIELLVTSMPACISMCDKRSNLPLHYICANNSGQCEVEMLHQLGADELYIMKNHVRLIIFADLKNIPGC